MYESLLPERARHGYRHSRWKGHLDARVQTLVARGYAARTVGRHLRDWVDFVAHYEQDAAELPADTCCRAVVDYLDRRRRCAGRNAYRQVRAALRLLLEREEDWVHKPRRQRGLTPALYAASVPGYLSFARQHRGRRDLRATEWVLSEFFSWLESQDVEDLGSLSPVHVRDYLASREHLQRVTVADHASQLRCFLRYLAMEGQVDSALAMAVVSPRLYARSEPPQVLDPDTVERLIEAVDRSTALGKRDYAILLLAARYGMRPCDIRRLRLEEIHWRQHRIAFVQAKTQTPLELPLLAEVDEALVDYLRHGRPACAVREVFLRHVPPIAPFGSHNNLWAVLDRAFRASGIEPPEKRRGLYLLRHSAATRMLGQGVPFETIADVLGHASADTTRVYAQVDIAALRSVALSVAQVRS